MSNSYSETMRTYLSPHISQSHIPIGHLLSTMIVYIHDIVLIDRYDLFVTKIYYSSCQSPVFGWL